jgi:hypothetical protein
MFSMARGSLAPFKTTGFEGEDILPQAMRDTLSDMSRKRTKLLNGLRRRAIIKKRLNVSTKKWRHLRRS